MLLMRRASDVERIVRRHVPDNAIKPAARRKLIRELERRSEDGGGRGWFMGRRRTLAGALFVGFGRSLAAVALCLVWPITALAGTRHGRRTVATRRWLVDRVRGASRRDSYQTDDRGDEPS